MKNEGGDRRTECGSHSRNRRDSDRQQQKEPDGGVNRCSERQQRNQDSKEGGDALAAAELQPEWVEMSDQRAGGREPGMS